MVQWLSIWIFLSHCNLNHSTLPMPIIIKTRREIEMMRRAGQVGCQILARRCAKPLRPASPPANWMSWPRIELEQAGAIGLEQELPDLQAGRRISRRDLHQRQRRSRPRHSRAAGSCKEGDVVTLDLALRSTAIVPTPRPRSRSATIDPTVPKLLDVTRETLELAINNIKPGRKWSDIARLMQYHVESNGFSVVREFVGHGIGRTMHEDPKVREFRDRRAAPRRFQAAAGHDPGGRADGGPGRA